MSPTTPTSSPTAAPAGALPSPEPPAGGLGAARYGPLVGAFVVRGRRA